VIKWLKLPAGKRPGLVTLYFDQPDGVGHTYGPEHPETGKVVQSLDSILNYLRTGLAALEHSDLINLIVVSDHGMGPISPERYLNLYDYMEEDWVDMVIGGNPVFLIDAADDMQDSVARVLPPMICKTLWPACWTGWKACLHGRKGICQRISIMEAAIAFLASWWWPTASGASV
jgi:alkaline phosphatase D